MKEKNWCECSKQERRRIYEIDRQRKIALKQFQDGKISKEEHLKRLDDLERKLNECEMKYERI